jgi:hypothetical protein
VLAFEAISRISSVVQAALLMTVLPESCWRREAESDQMGDVATRELAIYFFHRLDL